MNEAAFFEQLLNSAKKDTAVVANLRRSAAYDPGLYPPVFRYVEPYIHNLSEWRRTATYLAAAYWALAVRMGRDGDKDNTLAEAHSLPKALRVLQARSADTSKTKTRDACTLTHNEFIHINNTIIIPTGPRMRQHNLDVHFAMSCATHSTFAAHVLATTH